MKNIDEFIESKLNEVNLSREFSNLLTVDNIPEAISLFTAVLRNLGYNKTASEMFNIKKTAMNEKSKLLFG